MANVQTLNQIVKNLQEIADKHRQLSDFKFGDPWEFTASGIAVTPVMWVQPQPMEAGRNTIDYKFRLWLLDSVKRGEDNETEVLSDMSLVALDILAQLRHPDYGWLFDFTQKNTINPITENSDYKLSGVWLDISIKLLYPGDTCRIPFETTPTKYPIQ